MSVNPGMLSSETAEWETPADFYAEQHARWRFTLDVCASAANAKCARYFDKAADGISQDWGTETCWMNPPYGKEIIRWMRKAWAASMGGATVVCLVPARTDTRWWHTYAKRGEIDFLKGRLKFGGAKNCAPFPSAIVVFRGRPQ